MSIMSDGEVQDREKQRLLHSNMLRERCFHRLIFCSLDLQYVVTMLGDPREHFPHQGTKSLFSCLARLGFKSVNILILEFSKCSGNKQECVEGT